MAVFVALGAATAHATPPVRTTSHVQGDIVVPGGTGFCAFDVREQWSSDLSWLTFADGSYLVHAKHVDVLTVVSTGRQAVLTETYNSHVDPTTNTGRTEGKLLQLRDAHGRLLFHTEAGQITFVGSDVTQTPNARGLATPEPICEALSRL